MIGLVCHDGKVVDSLKTFLANLSLSSPRIDRTIRSTNGMIYNNIQARFKTL